jgi:hypothetical protein
VHELSVWIAAERSNAERSNEDAERHYNEFARLSMKIAGHGDWLRSIVSTVSFG